MKGCLQSNGSLIYVALLVTTLTKMCTWQPKQSVDNVDRRGRVRWKPLQKTVFMQNKEHTLVCMETKEYIYIVLFKVILFMFNNLKGCRWSLRLITALFTLGPIQFCHQQELTKTTLTRFLFMHICTHANVHKYKQRN